jgi:predicted sulfurtransferase
MAKFSEVPLVSVDDAIADSSIILVDIRSQEEMNVSTIMGAITVAEYEDKIASYSGKQVVVFDTLGYGNASWISISQINP